MPKERHLTEIFTDKVRSNTRPIASVGSVGIGALLLGDVIEKDNVTATGAIIAGASYTSIATAWAHFYATKGIDRVKERIRRNSQ